MPLLQIEIIAVYVALSLLVAFLGRKRKWGFWGFLWASILFTPLVSILCVAASSPPAPPAVREKPLSGKRD